MKVVLDKNGYFTGDYAEVGDLKNSVEVSELPKRTGRYVYQSYKLVDDEWIFDKDRYKLLIEENKGSQIQSSVLELQEQLKASDYKIIKCFECHALGLKLPYDIKELHEERQQLRDSINILQGKEN